MRTRPQADTISTARAVLDARKALKTMELTDPGRSGRIRLQLIGLQRRFRAGVITEQQFAHFVAGLGLQSSIAA